MKIANLIGLFKLFIFWFACATIGVSATLQDNQSESFVSDDILPYGFSISSLQGHNEVDPRGKITLAAEGLGARLSKVELYNDKGEVLFEATDQTRVSLSAPLAFGTHYKIKVTVVQPWSGQSEAREIEFTTVAVSNLLGPALRTLEPDSTITLNFDQPVREVHATGSLTLTAVADPTGQTIRLLASGYEQDHRYPIQISYKTRTGVPLPPVNLELNSPPALTAETNMRGLTNLGLVLPLKLTFSEPLTNRENAMESLQVRTREGSVISGKWRWIGERQLKFTPQPAWPASSMIEVSNDGKNLRSIRGGTLEQARIEQFSTGTDRRLFVYLDSQLVEAVENGEVIRTFKVSTGKTKTPTVTGSFYIYDRYRHKTMKSDVGRGQRGFYEVEDVPYTQFFHNDYAFHGAYWHNSFGSPASHGCINMATKEKNKRWPKVSEDAGWLFKWGALGVPVTVVQKAPKPVQAAIVQAKENKNAKVMEEAKSGLELPEVASRKESSVKVVTR
jgi:lipoprotein-anchoring transpeptidase ErfK/SrfK